MTAIQLSGILIKSPFSSSALQMQAHIIGNTPEKKKMLKNHKTHAGRLNYTSCFCLCSSSDILLIKMFSSADQVLLFEGPVTTAYSSLCWF